MQGNPKQSYKVLPFTKWNSLDPADQGLFIMGPKLSYKIHLNISSCMGAEYKTHQEDCKGNKDFYFGAQMTPEQKLIYDDRGQYALIINKVRKAIRSIAGILTSTKPKFNALPNNPNKLFTAKIANKIFDWVWSNSKGIQTYRKMVLRALRDNISYAFVRPTNDGKIKYEPLSYDDVIVDPHSKDSCFEDATMIGILRNVEEETIKNFFGIHNIYTQRPVEWKNFITTDEAYPLIGKIYTTNKNWVTLYETYRKIPYRAENGFIFNRIVKETIIGMQHIYREILPEEITEYPLIPFASEDTENPYKYGEVHFLRQLQDFYNRAFGTLIYNAQLLSNPKVMMKSTALMAGDKTTFENEFAVPGSVNVIADDGKPISDSILVIGGQPLNAAFYMLKQDTDREFEGATVPKQVQGYHNSTQEYRQLSRLDMLETVIDSYKLTCSNFETSLSQLGKIILQNFRAYMKNEKTILLVTGTGEQYERLSLNMKKGLNMKDENSIKGFVQQAQQAGVPEEKIMEHLDQLRDDSTEMKELSEYINDVASIDFTMQVIPLSYSPTYELSQLALMRELASEGIVDAEAVLSKIPDADRVKIMKRMSQVGILMQQVEQLTELNEQLVKEVEKYKGEITQSQLDAIINEAQLKADYVVKDVRMKAYLEKVKNKIESKQILNELELKVKELLFVLKRNYELKIKNEVVPSYLEDIITG